MINEKLLKLAISLLEGLDLSNSESVQINHTKYDDGSSLVEVGVSFPATTDDTRPAKVTRAELDEIITKGFTVSGYAKD